MATCTQIKLCFWDDEKIEEEFTPEDKYIYLYLLTNPRINMCGCYRFRMAEVMKQTGYNEETVLRLLKRMKEIHGVINFNLATSEIFIRNWYKHNWTSSSKLLDGIIKSAEDIKDSLFKEEVIETAKALKKGEKPEKKVEEDTLSIGYAYPIFSTDNNINNNILSFDSKNSNEDNFINILSTYKDKDYIENNIELKNCIIDWLAYKDERKPKSSNHYGSERGLVVLINKFVESAKEYGVEAVKNTVEFSMGNNYQGIVWDALKKRQRAWSKPANTAEYVDRWRSV